MSTATPRRSRACSAAARITCSVPTRRTRRSIRCERRWTAATRSYRSRAPAARTGCEREQQHRIARVRGQRHRPADGGRRHLDLALLTYRETQPNRWLRNYALNLNRLANGTSAAIRNRTSGRQCKLTWLNFWTTNAPRRGSSARPTDEHAHARRPADERFRRRSKGSSRSRARTATQTQVSAGMYYTVTRTDGGRSALLRTAVSTAASPRWQMSVSRPSSTRSMAEQYVATLDGRSGRHVRQHYVFARVDRTTYSTQLRVNYTVKPDLTLDVYAEPFAASGAYGPTEELVAAQAASFGRSMCRATATSTRSRSAAMSCCDGNGSLAARCLSSGSRIARPRHPSGRAPRSATCLIPSRRPAITCWP